MYSNNYSRAGTTKAGACMFWVIFTVILFGSIMNCCNDICAEIGMDDDVAVIAKNAGQLTHRFINNFHIHQGEQTTCGTCGDEKVCLRCSHVGKRECEVCGIWISRASFAEHNRVHTGERPYKCTACPASFKQSHHLEEHLRIHAGEKPLLCEMCGMQFRVLANLKQHQDSKHSSDPKHQCEQCGRAFKQRQGLMRHMRRVHGRVYTCRQCNEILATRNEFTAHCVAHTQGAPKVE